MAKPASIQIKLVSTADTGFYYVTKKILEIILKKWNLKNTILKLKARYF